MHHPRVPERVERAGLAQRFDDLLVAGDRVDLAEEVGEVLERALPLAGPDDRLHDVVPDVADRGEPEPDVGADPDVDPLHVALAMFQLAFSAVVSVSLLRLTAWQRRYEGLEAQLNDAAFRRELVSWIRFTPAASRYSPNS